MAQGSVFEQAEEMLLELLGLSISAKQIQRLSEHYGERLEEHLQEQVAGKAQAPVLPLKDKEEAVYVLLDGSMVFSREKGWTEMKVGRLFGAASRIQVQADREEVMHSLYVCHVGGHKKFLEKLEAYTDAYRRKVLICDGAKWIWNWVEDAYPEAVQILDFYHAVEKLGLYAGFQYREEEERRQWLEAKKQMLLRGGVERLLSELKDAAAGSQEARKARADVLRYYEGNQSRMQYHLYLEKGYMIGSGAIEAAHRSVVQQRLKLSGQHWSKDGAQQILNLRATRKSKQWNKVVELIKSAA